MLAFIAIANLRTQISPDLISIQDLRSLYNILRNPSEGIFLASIFDDFFSFIHSFLR